MNVIDGRYEVTFQSKDGSVIIEDRDGVRWYDAPIPPKRHKCWPQTKAWTNYFTRIYRCGCGAISIDPSKYHKIIWDQVNSRRDRARETWGDPTEAGPALPVRSRFRRFFMRHHQGEDTTHDW